jgi:mRNA-degrading endonuclease toxin of MazEF toxin-antitoxin module
VRRGEVYWGRPSVPGNERKRRPFLVVSDDAFNANERWTRVVVVHLTSVRRAGGPFDWEVDLPRGAARLPTASVAKCAEPYTLWKTQLDEQIGTLAADDMCRVDAALRVALGLRD